MIPICGREGGRYNATPSRGTLWRPPSRPQSKSRIGVPLAKPGAKFVLTRLRASGPRGCVTGYASRSPWRWRSPTCRKRVLTIRRAKAPRTHLAPGSARGIADDPRFAAAKAAAITPPSRGTLWRPPSRPQNEMPIDVPLAEPGG